MLNVSIWYRYISILIGIGRFQSLLNDTIRYRYEHDDKLKVIVINQLKILWFMNELLQVFRNLPLKSIHIFSYVPISEEAPTFFRKFHEIINKIFQEFVG